MLKNNHSDKIAALAVAKQRLESKVHVLLDMAVKQREAWLVGHQVHHGPAKCGNDHRVLQDAGSGLAVELDEFEQVPVEVQWVRIVTAIVKHQPVAASLVEDEFPLMRIFLAVDEPMVDPMRPARHFFKDHVDGLVRGRMRRGVAKDRVIPARLLRRKPLRALLLIGVLHHDTHAGLTRHIANGS